MVKGKQRLVRDSGRSDRDACLLGRLTLTLLHWLFLFLINVLIQSVIQFGRFRRGQRMNEFSVIARTVMQVLAWKEIEHSLKFSMSVLTS